MNSPASFRKAVLLPLATLQRPAVARQCCRSRFALIQASPPPPCCMCCCVYLLVMCSRVAADFTLLAGSTLCSRSSVLPLALRPPLIQACPPPPCCMCCCVYLLVMCCRDAADVMLLAGSSSTQPSSLAPVVLLSLKWPSPWSPACGCLLAVAEQAVGLRPQFSSTSVPLRCCGFQQ